MSMKRGTFSILAVFLTLAAFADGALTCARDVAWAAFYAPSATNRLPFNFTGRITYVREAHDSLSRIIAVEDASGAVTLSCPTNIAAGAALAPGDMAELSGNVLQRTNARLKSCRVLSSGPKVEAIESNMTDLLNGLHDFRLSRFTGTLRDIAESETASRWLILVICDRNERLFVSVPDRPGTRERLTKLLGSRVSATGVCVPQDASLRLRVGRTFKVAKDEDIRLADETSNETIPDINDIQCTRPNEILSLGRHAAAGRVIAVWQGKHALLALGPRGTTIAGLEFADGVVPPCYGDFIQAVGLPESDLYRINLTNVAWSRLPGTAYDKPQAQPVSAQDILAQKFGYRLVLNQYHGRAIALHGIVRSLSGNNAQMHIDCDGVLIPVDASVQPGILNDIEIGSQVLVSGTCVVQQEKMRSSAAFPRMGGFSLVIRTPDDIIITERPSWWTPRRLMFAICGLLAILLFVIVSNSLKKRVAARMAKIAIDLKVEERTRLAVELHDSLAQNLSGVSLEIDTATKLAGTDPTAMNEHLNSAARSLKSCRDELRNCLWDLRNRALEEGSMGEAIRQTLAPHIPGVEVFLRFNVSRDRISDNTAHAILRIIRELTLNAIRHGHATKLWIAGSIEGGKLRFSVRDNGCGFNPATAPGFANGHYGLVGISERVEAFEGGFEIESAPGKGCKATIVLNMPKEEE